MLKPWHAWKLHSREPGDPIGPVAEDAPGRLEEGHEPGLQHARRWGVGRLHTPVDVSNNSAQPLAEGMEGRQPIEENIGQATAPRTQRRISALSDLNGVRKVAWRQARRARCAPPQMTITVSGRVWKPPSSQPRSCG